METGIRPGAPAADPAVGGAVPRHRAAGHRAPGLAVGSASREGEPSAFAWVFGATLGILAVVGLAVGGVKARRGRLD